MSGAGEGEAEDISTVDNYQRLQIAPNPDGNITRLAKFPESPPTSDPKLPTPVLSKDIPINESKKTWVRIYLPPPRTGSFLLLQVTSRPSTIFHDYCVGFATDVPVIIASVEYRLAPEHRLPAAYEDATEALHWIKTTPDDWLRDHADLSNTFLMGISAGGNIAYHAALHADVDRLHPLKIHGLILQQPFFSGTQRTGSELRLANNHAFPLSCSDLMWDLSLPTGASRDHEYCNPTVRDGCKKLDRMAVGWRVLVTGWDGDPLIDRQIEVAKMLEENGVHVVCHFAEGGYHGIDIFDASKGKALFVVVKNFIFSQSAR
ncbi:unnamed protein product [Prunus armeniaca]|uniref:Alpha/beta hydrolase fold-3 domain-containing protein n=1 Tax=Prunus armeniaca TaxID=36596 RepID=A0A6J5WN29_PRUAR|nr:unnamed protein product [Prunus armeniaca]